MVWLPAPDPRPGRHDCSRSRSGVRHRSVGCHVRDSRHRASSPAAGSRPGARHRALGRSRREHAHVASHALSTSSAFETRRELSKRLPGRLSIDSWAQPVRDGEQTFRVNLSPVTGNFFVVLGSKAVLGRTLVPDDDHPGAAPVAVLSYSLWRGQFAGNPAVLGRRLELRNSRVVTVVGVAPPGLEYPAGTEIWVPFANLSAVEVMPLGRLSSQATAQEAAAELRASFEREPKNEWRGPPRSRCPTAIIDPRRSAACTPSSHCGRRGVTAHGVFQRQQSAPASRRSASTGDCRAPGSWRQPRTNHPVASRRKPSPRTSGWPHWRLGGD